MRQAGIADEVDIQRAASQYLDARIIDVVA